MPLNDQALSRPKDQQGARISARRIPTWRCGRRPWMLTTVAVVAPPYPWQGSAEAGQDCWRGLTHQLLVRTCVRCGVSLSETSQVSRQSIEPSIPQQGGIDISTKLQAASGVRAGRVSWGRPAGDSHPDSGRSLPTPLEGHQGRMPCNEALGEQRGPGESSRLIRSGVHQRTARGVRASSDSSGVGRPANSWVQASASRSHSPVGWA